MNNPHDPILVSGAHGLVGSALCRALRSAGYTVHAMRRLPSTGAPLSAGGPHRAGEIPWDPESGAFHFDGPIHAVIHLAGENIAGGRWSTARKEKIRLSRVATTAALARFISAREPKPAQFFVASAVGWYGDRGTEILDEASPMGSGFLADVAAVWEAAAQPARDASIAVVHTRFGVVLARNGGVLGTMLPAFRFGLGGKLGAGAQYMSWISIDDVISAYLFLLQNPQLSGAFNFTSPTPVSNAEFTATLARTLHRPALVPVPAFALRLLLGRQMADELLLASARVIPKRLSDAGFQFRYPALEDALAAILRNAPESHRA